MFWASKNEKATGSLRLLKPSVLSNSRSVSVNLSSFNIFLFQVCSSQDTLMPLSKLLALLNANRRCAEGFGLLFAIVGHIIMTNIAIIKQTACVIFCIILFTY